MITPDEHNKIYNIAFKEGMKAGLDKAAGIAEANNWKSAAFRFRSESYKIQKRIREASVQAEKKV